MPAAITMKTALYHRTDGQSPKELDVLRENADGTFDLGTAENVIVSRCPATREAKAGHCSILEVPAPTKAEELAKDADTSADPKTDEKPDPKGGRKPGKDADKP